jgi:hypothetical protein
MLSGSVSVGAVCMVLQLGYNELGIQRLRYLSQTNSMPTPTLPVTVESLSNVPSDGSRCWKEKALWLMGVRLLSDEEYLERMKLQRDQYVRRIQELERKCQEERDVPGTTR